jgi:phosphohistidine swiveling domain-containing protein
MGRYILDINRAKSPSLAGLKASNLRYLKQAGFRIPETLVCSFAAYEDYLADRATVLARLRLELERQIKDNRSYGVRSSANVEEGQTYSFAGQFETFLNVNSVGGILAAIQRVWDSSRNDRAGTYLSRIGTHAGSRIKIGVIIQEMVDSEWAGVVFTKNPMNGMDEAIIEMVQGLGTGLNTAGTSPARWVHKWGRWIAKPQDGDERQPVAEEVISGARRIAARYGRPADLEWAYSKGVLYWLQLREITALKGINIYSNRISREFLPGQVKPLVWSVNVPLVNSAWKRLLIELAGREAASIEVDRMARAFHYRAYFNMGVIGDLFELLGMPRESIELMMGLDRPASGGPQMKPTAKTLKYLPRILAFAASKSFFDRKIRRFLSAESRQRWQAATSGLDGLGEEDTLGRVGKLYELNREGAYFVIVTQLLLGAYSFIYRRTAEDRGEDLATGVTFLRRDQLRDVDPTHELAMLNRKYRDLPEAERNRLAEWRLPGHSGSPQLEEFNAAFTGFLDRFGHLSDRSNDFSAVSWREQPETALELLIGYQAPPGRAQAEAVSPPPPRGLRGMLLRYLWRKAISYADYRERVNALYTYGYAQFRPAFLHLGRMLKGRGILDHEDDIFFLSMEEVRRAVTAGAAAESCRARVAERKIEMETYKDIELPSIIVDDFPPPSIPKQSIAREMVGTGTSRGCYHGRATVVRSSADFGKVKEADVIVIPYSDASWTPLFSKAGAVVSESGGMLSHASIVAREYGIPAVVSVADACRVEDGTPLTVDGSTGLVTIHRQTSIDPEAGSGVT